MGKATKAQSNPYYIARIAASACNDAFGSREGAADTLGIERTRLARIELDTVTPYPDEVRVMADIYNAPELMTYHCAHSCQIGRCLGDLLPETQPAGIAQLAVQAAVSLRRADDIREQLLDISADGIIDPSERLALEAILGQLSDIASVARQLYDIVRKLQGEDGSCRL